MAVLTHERRIVGLALIAGLPALVIALVLLWRGPVNVLLQVGLTVLMVAVWVAAVIKLHRHLIYPLQTLSNLLAALREEDFSIRGRGADADDALGNVMRELNTLAETLRTERLGAHEATALLRTVIAEIDVAIFAIDNTQHVALVNRFGARLLGHTNDELLGSHARTVGLGPVLDAEAGVHEMRFPGGTAQWEIRRTPFWQEGLPHELLVLADVSQPLRRQEREAWQRLIRVLGHELNNSLAPIKSIAGSLAGLLAHHPPPTDWQRDMREGLGVIENRAAALSRFTSAYAQLARLPEPHLRTVHFGPLAHRIAHLDTRVPVTLVPGPQATVLGDPDQLEQLFINVLRNAVDAAFETGGGVRIGWTTTIDGLEAWVEDDGPGLQNTANLFVPFFTTKPSGSGIGLVLSRQIAEAHGGTITLVNRSDHQGARATVTLPRPRHYARASRARHTTTSDSGVGA